MLLYLTVLFVSCLFFTYARSNQGTTLSPPNLRQKGGVQIVAFEEGGSQYSYSHYNEAKTPITQYKTQKSQSGVQKMSGLLKQASSASIGVLFALLTWRSLTAYEMADSFRNSFVRAMSVAPSIALLAMNLIGFVVNWMRPLNFKNYLKVILSLNIVREWVELAYNLLMIVLTSSRSAIPREVYFGRVFMNVWWTALTMAFSKSRWVSTEVFKSQLERQQQKQMEQVHQYYQQQQQQQREYQRQF